MVSLITFTYKENNTTVTLPSVIKHTVKYADGSDIAVKDLLEAGQKQKYYINIEYDRNVTTSNMISTNRTFTVTIKIEYEQADNTAVAKVINNNTLCPNNKHQEITSNIVCKRATTLHTDKCLIEDEESGCRAVNYNLNDTIIYGTCGTIGTLTAGDAFDCDVDGNGTYDEDERFYYVSPKDGEENSKYAKFIYYKSLQNNKYNEELINYLGPKNLLNYLPSTDIWPKVELTNNGVRQLKTINEKIKMDDGTSIPIFTYTGRAARLLTSNEINYDCEPDNSSIGFTAKGYLSKCEFLLEDTLFSNLSNNSAWYLENINPSLTNIGYTVFGPYVSLGGVGIDNKGFVRPAIEVSLKNIAY